MIRVLGQRILVLGESLQRLQSDVIIIPDNHAPVRHGEVLSTGPEVENLQPGDVVFFHENDGHSLKMSGDDARVYIIMHEETPVAYSPNVMDVKMAKDTEVQELRNQTDECRRAIQELKDEGERAMETFKRLKAEREQSEAVVTELMPPTPSPV